MILFTAKNEPGEEYIRKINKKIYNIFAQNLKDDTVFLDTTWLEYDDRLIDFVNSNKSKKFLLFSGMDWENTFCRKEPNKFLQENVDYEYIGNSHNEFYFSFWLEFAKEFFPVIKPNFIAEKYFMCLNRTPKSHRNYIVEGLYERDLQSKGIISLGSPTTYHQASKKLKTPITLNNELNIPNDISTFGPLELWEKYFFNVVNETTVHSNTFISEKTLKPILGYKPFMILGDQNLYKILHSWGIDTFDDIFGIGYEKSEWQDRANWIIEITEQLCSESLHQLQKLYYKLEQRLKNNVSFLRQQQEKNYQKMVEISKKF